MARNEAPNKGGKTPAKNNIRAEMVRAGVTSAQIARQADVDPNYVYLVLCGQRKGYRIRREIAKAVNKPVEVLFPDTPVEQRTAA